MFESYFGLTCDPFGMTPDPGFFFDTPAHREALASLHYSIRTDRGFTTLIAPPGLGKTTLLFRLLSDIRQTCRSVFLFDTRYGPRDLLIYILRDLNIEPKNTTSELLDQFHDVLLQVERSGQRFVLVIDEAQGLSRDTLETIRLLSNFERPGKKLMHIVLSGQTQLSEILMDPALTQLRQRISTICRLKPLCAVETAEYIEHRLRRAGYSGPPIFDAEGLRTIATFSGGVPRLINAICFNALTICCALKRKTVDAAILNEAMEDLQLPGPVVLSTREPLRPSARAASVAKRFPPISFRTAAWITAAVLLCALPGDQIGSSKAAAPAAVHAATSTSLLSQATSGHQLVPAAGLRRITIQADQTVTKIAQQQLGRSDRDLLLYIQSLNPDLKNLDLIQAGQTLLLPTNLTDTALHARNSHEPQL